MTMGKRINANAAAQFHVPTIYDGRLDGKPLRLLPLVVEFKRKQLRSTLAKDVAMSSGSILELSNCGSPATGVKTTVPRAAP